MRLYIDSKAKQKGTHMITLLRTRCRMKAAIPPEQRGVFTVGRVNKAASSGARSLIAHNI